MSGCQHGYGCNCGGGGWMPGYPSCPTGHHHHHHHEHHHHHPPTQTYSWAFASNGHVPPNAVYAGTDVGGSTLYVGRAHHEGDLIPGKVSPAHRCAFISWNGKEHRKYDYEVLVSTHSICWVSESHGRVPPNAVSAGRTKCGETLFVGRAMHMSTLTPGKIHPSHHCLYLPYGEQEISKTSYEALVIKYY